MTLDEWHVWLKNNASVVRIWTKAHHREVATFEVRVPDFPAIYSEFLERFGAIEVPGFTFLTRSGGIKEALKLRLFNDSELSHDHLVPFCVTGANSWCYCFDANHIVMFDALEPSLIDNTVAVNFEEFLAMVANMNSDDN